ncbi:MAG: SHOCT domain-containing protein [Pseudonocardia sp.]|nr:SHOCT domain-containing protein [Pseudonocardia sp.]
MLDHAMWQSHNAQVTPSWEVPAVAAAVESVEQTVSSAPAAASIVGELRNLAELYAAGALTDAEYVTAKVRLLN